MFDFLGKQKYPVILVVLGFFLTLVSYFEVEDITKLQFSRSSSPIYPLFFIGLLLIIISTFIYLYEEFTIDKNFSKIFFKSQKSVRVIKTKNGFSSFINSSLISIIFGRIESIKRDMDSSLVILPANEFFDDECINDKRSALGAFIQSEYLNKTESIQYLINGKLQKIPYKNVEKESGVFQLSYGIGTGIYLEQPLSSKNKILFLSVTTKRAGEGLRTEVAYIFEAINQIQRIVADKRLSSVYMPLIGSGHGGLRKEVALFSILLAVCNVLTRTSSQSIKEFNIVIFQADKEKQPSIQPDLVKRLLKITIGMFS